MTAWNMKRGNEVPRNILITYEKDGHREDFTFPRDKTLFDAVKGIADAKGLTAVNVLVDNLEISESEGMKELSNFAGRELKVLPKNTGSA